MTDWLIWLFDHSCFNANSTSSKEVLTAKTGWRSGILQQAFCQIKWDYRQTLKEPKRSCWPKRTPSISLFPLISWLRKQSQKKKSVFRREKIGEDFFFCLLAELTQLDSLSDTVYGCSCRQSTTRQPSSGPLSLPRWLGDRITDASDYLL